ncbi:MAG: hypothetical protein FJZ89_03695 [Chloroflexi bacterium]|nr:hypothetical protein [Chloroflexota bacterium]
MATCRYPLLAKIPQADLIFNVVFFIVLTSVVLQGTTIPLVARWLHVDAPTPSKPIFPIDHIPVSGIKCELEELVIPAGSSADGKAIVELGLPAEFLVVLISRNDEYLIPSGGTTLLAGDTLLVLAAKEIFQRVQSQVGATS